MLLSPGTLHTDPEQFAEPFEFDPDRFGAAQSAGRHPFAFVPFSAGPRNCIGQKFALMEEKTVLSWLFRRFRVQPAKSFYTNVPCPEIILRPSAGLPIRLQARTH